MSASLTAKREEYGAKLKTLGTIFAEAKNDAGDIDFKLVKSLEGDQAARIEKVNSLNAELAELKGEVDNLTKTHNDADAVASSLKDWNTPAHGAQHTGTKGGEVHTFGSLFVRSDAIKGRGGRGPEGQIDLGEAAHIGLKTLFATSAGWAPETIRTGRVVDDAQRPVQVLDLIPGATTTQSAVVYMEETTFTNASDGTAEGGSFPESALALTEVSSPVRKISTYLPVTDEQLEDVPQAQAYVNNRLSFMLRQELDRQVLVASASPDLIGVTNRAGIQTQIKGADPTPDAIYKAMTKIMVNAYANPTAVVMHGNDWQDIRLLRTADGLYIWGSPLEQGQPMIWGIPVVRSEALTEGTALVGDWATHSQLSIRRNVTLQVSNSHSTFFVEGKQAIRADLRASLEVFRPAAFCTVTGI